jgi:hypothetical protein
MANKTKLQKEMDRDYPCINMSDVDDEARLLAVRWGDAFDLSFIDMVKLASDFMNYARRKNAKEHKGFF